MIHKEICLTKVDTRRFVEGRLMDADGRLLVRATSSVMLVPAERVAAQP